MKVPCIKCNHNIWKHLIEPNLKKWGYYRVPTMDLHWEAFPLLVINVDNVIGRCTNLASNAAERSNRELVTDVHEFLRRAAELKGFTYNYKETEKMVVNGITLQPGMVLEGIDAKNNAVTLVVTPTDSGLYFMSTDGKFVSDYRTIIRRLSCIRARPTGNNLKSGKALWEKVFLTIKEIADKFGIPEENITIVW